jgi:predicted RNA-binding Zn-ribbon protein involved in translation (DUF1610 family)
MKGLLHKRPRDEGLGKIIDEILLLRSNLTSKDATLKDTLNKMASILGIFYKRGVAFSQCPKCGSKMVLRFRRSDNNPFFGCTKYPNCKGTLDYYGRPPHVRRMYHVGGEDFSRELMNEVYGSVYYGEDMVL